MAHSLSQMNDEMAATRRYYERRAPEYDATSWDDLGDPGDRLLVRSIRKVLSSLDSQSTLDVGCGTGYVSRWLPGQITLLDASVSMLSIASDRLPYARRVQAIAPPLPFLTAAFGRVFAANLYGHLPPSSRSDLAAEMMRVAGEVVVLDELSQSSHHSEGIELRTLNDGTPSRVYKTYFTLQSLKRELHANEVLFGGPTLGIVRWRKT